jgi:hypothetical protein
VSKTPQKLMQQVEKFNGFTCVRKCRAQSPQNNKLIPLTGVGTCGTGERSRLAE